MAVSQMVHQGPRFPEATHPVGQGPTDQLLHLSSTNPCPDSQVRKPCGQTFPAGDCLWPRSLASGTREGPGGPYLRGNWLRPKGGAASVLVSGR